jgi:hypothetical protein
MLLNPPNYSLCCLGLLQNPANIYTKVIHHPPQHQNNVAITYQQYQKVQVYMVHHQSWLWQHNCRIPRTTGVQHLKVNFIKSIIITACFWHVMQCSWWMWDSIYQTTWHHIPDENIFIITTMKTSNLRQIYYIKLVIIKSTKINSISCKVCAFLFSNVRRLNGQDCAATPVNLHKHTAVFCGLSQTLKHSMTTSKFLPSHNQTSSNLPKGISSKCTGSAAHILHKFIPNMCL